MRASLLLLAGGCQTLFPLEGEVSDAQPDGPVLVLSPACDPGDPRLIACYDFEDNLDDVSLRANHGTGNGIEFGDGVEGLAVSVGFDARIDLLTAKLDASSITIDTWVNLDVTGSQQILIDHDDRWAIFLEPTGELVCSGAGVFARSQEPVPSDIWFHVACTMTTGGESPDIRLYIDGVFITSVPGVPTLAPTNPATIGNNAPATQPSFPALGRLDRLRVWNAVLPDHEIAAAAGLPPSP